MQPVFLFSLDCEGKWGLADRITPEIEQTFNNTALTRAYQEILNVLGDLGLKGTFAYVAAYTLPPDAYKDRPDLFKDIIVNGADWLGRMKSDMAAGRSDGWFNPDALAVVREDPRHEIASHGFSHRPLGPRFSTVEEVRRELQQVREVPYFQEAGDLTLVYPRNLVGHVGTLREYGIVGYRDTIRTASRFLERPRSLLRELKLWEPAQDHACAGVPVSIPSGYFLNWRSGVRRTVPVRITAARWRSIIDDAIATNRVAHLWSHPHNFMTGSGMYGLLRSILSYAAARVAEGSMVSMTQRDYVRYITNGGNISG